MTIPKEIISKWEIMKSQGDAVKISDRSGIGAETIRRAMRSGEATDEVFEAIAMFYAEREDLINQYID